MTCNILSDFSYPQILKSRKYFFTRSLIWFLETLKNTVNALIIDCYKMLEWSLLLENIFYVQDSDVVGAMIIHV